MEITAVSCIFNCGMWIVAPPYFNGMSVDMLEQMKSGVTKKMSRRVLLKLPKERHVRVRICLCNLGLFRFATIAFCDFTINLKNSLHNFVH